MLLRILGALILIIVLLVAVIAYLMQPPGLDEVRGAWMGENDRLVEAAGQTWRVRETGPENAPAIVLIHGFSHSLEGFEALAERLDDDHRVIRFDLPGHALTGPRADEAYSVSDTLAQVSGLLDEIAPGRFAIAGNSLGGLIAWRYAANNPERVSHLALISPGGYPNLGVGEEPAPVPAQIRLFLATAPEAGVRAATATLYADPSRMTDADVERIGALMRIEGVGDALIKRIEQFTLPDPNPSLRQIQAETLIIWGAADIMVTPEHGPRFAAAIPNAELILLNDAGHMAQVEQPDKVADAIRALLN